LEADVENRNSQVDCEMGRVKHEHDSKERHLLRCDFYEKVSYEIEWIESQEDDCMTFEKFDIIYG